MARPASASVTPWAPDLWTVRPATVPGRGVLEIHPHYGQMEALDARQRYVLVLAGTQSGKTSFGPVWLYNEIKRCGPGDYGVIGPTDASLQAKAIPEFLRLFRGALRLGRYVASPRPKFFITSRSAKMHLFGRDDVPDTTIHFCYGSDPESVESYTWLAAWIDEAGQKRFKRESHQAIERRLSLARGRILYTTTPYRLGWLKYDVYDRAIARDPDYALINFPSIANPRFTRAEWNTQKRALPRWLFNMMYRGRFERPAGMIYGEWSDEENLVPWFAIPEHWPRYLGLDFGGVNTAGLFLALEMNDETGLPVSPRRFYAYREYHAGGRTAGEHVAALLAGETSRPVAVGGAPSEGQWRDEFARAGLPVWAPPVADVEVGIARLVGAVQTRQLRVLAGTCPIFRDQIATYSRVLDEMGEPTEKIEDKETYHHLDAGRYIVAWLRQGKATLAVD